MRVCRILLFLLFLRATAHAQIILVDAHGTGPIFQGIGAISGGGGNSRLLFDYPEPVRGQILDFLFKPNYGASLQILKVEIGADMDSTSGAESSHQHTRTDQNYDRGYEWWLMEQAKARNPEIKLEALPWGAPHWVGDGNYWSPDMVAYIIRWLKAAQSVHHLTIDYLGGRNEHGYDTAWYKSLRAGLVANGLDKVQVVASDDWEKNKLWKIASEMRNDPALNAAIDIVGTHGPAWGGWATPDALALGKPLWDSESHIDEKTPWKEAARNLNRNFVLGHVTSTAFWPIVSAIYDNIPYDDIGLLKSNQPWSGHYNLTPTLWAAAHTTQFTQPGWRYVEGGSGVLAGDKTGAHGTFVTLVSPDNRSWSTVIETAEATASSSVDLQLNGFPASPVHLWTSNPAAGDAQLFQQQADLTPANGHLSLRIEPGRIYTLTNTAGQGKGTAVSPPAAPLPLPFADNFDSYAPGKLARYFSDMVGGFESATCAAGRNGTCLAQVVPVEPTSWKKTVQRPFTMAGSLQWTNYRVSVDALLQQPGSVDLIARLTGMSERDVPNSYVLRLADTGEWLLLRSNASNAKDRVESTTLASGKVPPRGLNTWHNLAVSCSGATISAMIDGKTVASVSDTNNPAGMIGLGTLPYVAAQFDNLKVESLP